MALAEDDDVIKAFPADRADQSLRMSVLPMRPQPIDATQALNLSAGVSNSNVCRGRSLS